MYFVFAYNFEVNLLISSWFTPLSQWVLCGFNFSTIIVVLIIYATFTMSRLVATNYIKIYLTFDTFKLYSKLIFLVSGYFQ
jgi:hypothetical protein